MKAVEQPEESWAQFLLGILHLHALAVASVAVYIHARAVQHHFQRAGVLPADHIADAGQMVDMTYLQAIRHRAGRADTE